MGRKIPAKKHRGVKDPLVQQAKRLARYVACRMFFYYLPISGLTLFKRIPFYLGSVGLTHFLLPFCHCDAMIFLFLYISFLIQSIHLLCGLPLSLHPFIFIPVTVFGKQVSSLLITCTYQDRRLSV